MRKAGQKRRVTAERNHAPAKPSMADAHLLARPRTMPFVRPSARRVDLDTPLIDLLRHFLSEGRKGLYSQGFDLGERLVATPARSTIDFFAVFFLASH